MDYFRRYSTKTILYRGVIDGQLQRLFYFGGISDVNLQIEAVLFRGIPDVTLQRLFYFGVLWTISLSGFSIFKFHRLCFFRVVQPLHVVTCHMLFDFSVFLT